MEVRPVDVMELGQAATGAVTDAIPKGMAVTSRAVTQAARDTVTALSRLLSRALSRPRKEASRSGHGFMASGRGSGLASRLIRPAKAKSAPWRSGKRRDRRPSHDL